MNNYRFIIIVGILTSIITTLNSCSESRPFDPPTVISPPDTRNHNINSAIVNTNNRNTNKTNANSLSANSNVNVNKSDEFPTPVCVLEDYQYFRQTCTFTLDGYEKKEYVFEAGKDKNVKAKEESENKRKMFVKGVASFIESKKAVTSCNFLAITSWGYADSLKLEETALKRSDVIEMCQPPIAENNYLTSAGGVYLTNKGLAYVRECLIRNEIDSSIDKKFSIAPKDWGSDAKEYDIKKPKVGEEYRLVLIKIETSGSCP